MNQLGKNTTHNGENITLKPLLNEHFTSLLKKAFLCFTILFPNTYLFSQSTNLEDNQPLGKHQYGDTIHLNINEQIQLIDSLSVRLVHFSHKRPKTGGLTKTTAYITLTKNNLTEEKSLSVHGTQNKLDYKEYDSLIWREYEFHLKALNYGNFIEVIINKKNSQ